MPDGIVGFYWSMDQFRDAQENLILRSGLPLTAQNFVGRPPSKLFFENAQSIRRSPRSVGLDVIEETSIPMQQLFRRLLQINGPILLALETSWGDMVAVTAILGPGARARLLTSDGREVSMRRTTLHREIARLRVPESSVIRTIFESLPDGPAVLRELENNDAFTDGSRILLTHFALDGSHPLASQISASGGWTALATHVVLSLLQALVALGALWTLGSTMIDGQVDIERVLGWSLLALSDAPLQYLASRSLAQFSIAFGAGMKRRLLEGTFSVPEKEVRAKGFGELLARTNEASVVEQLSLAEVSGVVAALFQTIGAAVFLARGQPSLASLLALGTCMVVAALVVRTSVKRYRAVYARRMDLTDDLVDKIIGHRTRAIQQSPGHRHADEDYDLGEYAKIGAQLDRIRSLSAIMPRVWLTVGGGILLAAFIARAPLAALVNSGLGILLCYRALVAFFPAVERMVEWYTAWKAIEPLIIAGAHRGRAATPPDPDEDKKFGTTLSLSSVNFAYRQGGRPVLSDINLRVQKGERILLEGPSGAGKTTLLKLIAGEQSTSGGIILVGGSDRSSVSDVEWRRRVASAPQFHENYIFSNTLSFNLDPWGEPGLEGEEVLEICRELDLLPLIARMPQGFSQMIGETGWQLSHGERSRVFIARALTQRSNLVLFDESFGALDPETLKTALECVRKRAKTLIVIAHT